MAFLSSFFCCFHKSKKVSSKKGVSLSTDLKESHSETRTEPNHPNRSSPPILMTYFPTGSRPSPL
ncbi:hypothetical protein Scep_028790 [Stephania cephalantha]|uniref:Uncharacterized protein n=2 Tax=Stephania TaxID=147243 RepID=A0AAP0EHW4_9MAGN